MPPYRFMHWNIKELDRQAIATRSPACVAAIELLRAYPCDLLSINELEFGPGQSSDSFRQWLQLVVPDAESWQESFFAANSGQRAKPAADGCYLRFHDSLSAEERSLYLDQANFGLFPGQFSIGFGTRFPIRERLLIRDLSWQQWDPEAPLETFDLGGMSPQEFPLFDKSFQVSMCEVDGRALAVITLHTVPAFGFGQAKSPNVSRNAAQLEFLAWYLTGEHPRGQKPSLAVRPLAADIPFIAVGDFNISLDSRDLGARALQHILQHPRCHPTVSHIPTQQLNDNLPIRAEHTFFSSGWDIKRGLCQLDYFMVSNELKIHRLETIFHDPQFVDHGLFLSIEEALKRQGSLSQQGRVFSIVPLSTARGQQLFLLRSADAAFARLRTASDHLPLLLEFSFAF